MADDPNERALARLRDRAGRALGDQKVKSAVQKVKAIVGPHMIPASEVEAQAAWDKLRNGEAPTTNELQALELVIRLLRPALLSHGGVLDDLPDQAEKNVYPPELKEAWRSFRDRVRPQLYSIGRIELADGTHVGTGFLVAAGMLATNRHVLDELTLGTGSLAPGRARVVFQREQGATDSEQHVVAVEAAVRYDTMLDMALLAVRDQGRPIVEIDAAAVTEGERVAVIGYPAKDADRNPIFMDAIFGGVYGVKRAALGEILDGAYPSTVFHDCSTLGGNSGSPVFALASGKVVGIHRSGYFMYRNEAVDGASLGRFVAPPATQ